VNEPEIVSVMIDAAESGLVVFQEDGRRTQGEPPVMVAERAFCKDCGQEHEFEKCPRCGSDIYHGYGLGSGGGFGPYAVCENDCGWFFKTYEAHE
jgi:hypothetical protein